MLRIGGVPEHFNLPWMDAIESLVADGRDIEWRDFPGGTGAMAQAMRDGELDLALMLTEGAVAAIGAGLDARICAIYVGSPLIWGIHAAGDSDIEGPEDFRGGVYAISRFGSGSELMALVDARIRRWPTDELQFEVIQNFTGAREALAEGRADVFFWERFMTKPTVDSGEFKLVDVRPTPWPSFVAVATKSLLKNSGVDLSGIFSKVRAAADRLVDAPEETAQRISDTYGIQLADALEWMNKIQWTARPIMDRKVLDDVASHLRHAGRLPDDYDVEDTVTPEIASAWGPTMYDWRAEALQGALDAAGLSQGPLTVDRLVEIGSPDHYHYLGTAACDAVIEQLGISSGDRVMDAGAGVGGPARYLASKADCDVTAVELRREWVELGTELTARCGLADKVVMRQGDVAELTERDAYDHIISMRVLLHLAERAPAIRTFHRSLKPGGNLIIEDFVALREMTTIERFALETIISAPRVLSQAAYVREVEAASFDVVDVSDLTDQWKAWTRARFDAYRKQYAREHELHGASIVDDRLTLYGAAADLFASGAIGGFRLHARKPPRQ